MLQALIVKRSSVCRIAFWMVAVIGAINIVFDSVGILMSIRKNIETVNQEEKVQINTQYFDNGNKSFEVVSSAGEIIGERFWNNEGNLTSHIQYEYPGDGTFIKKILSPDSKESSIVEKNRFIGRKGEAHFLIRKWDYDRETRKLIGFEDVLPGTRITLIQWNYDGDWFECIYLYDYYPHELEKGHLRGFKTINKDGQIIKSYFEDRGLDVEKIIKNKKASPDCIFRAIANTIPNDREQCSDSSRTAFRMIANSFPEHPEQRNLNY